MIRKPVILTLLPLVVVLVSFAIQADASPGVAKEDLGKIMPLSEVRTGMKGYGLTVFHGTTIEKFDVQILGILRKVNSGKDLILARLAGGPITTRGANIIQGMSGSPVYVNGRIIGAVAYGAGSFSREPLGMLTPIEDMLDSLDPKLPARPSGMSSPVSTLQSPIQIGSEVIKRVEIRSPSSRGPAPDGTLVMTPLMTPLMVSGMSSRGIASLAELLQPYGILPMAGPGAKADPITVQFQPGAGIGLSLASGDIDLTVVGTVTYRRGDKIVAFGHPMFGFGPIDAPMTTAYVHAIFPSYQISSRIASPMKTVGRILQDRPWSVGGELGKTPRMIPVTVDVDDAVTARKRTMHIKVINHPLLAPGLLLRISGEALIESHGISGEAMAKVKVEIEADQIGKIVRSNVFFDPTSIEDASTQDLGGLLSILSSNKFYPLDVKSVRLSVRIEPGRKTAAIERIFVDKAKYEPGETVNVGVELRPYKSEKITRTVRVKVPEDAPDGRISLQVRGGMGDSGPTPIVISLDGGPGGPGGPVGPRPIVSPSGVAENIRQLIDKYLEQPKNDELVAKLTLSTPAVSVSGQKLSDLPDPIASVMKSPRSSTVKLEPDDVKVLEPMDYVVIGGQSLSINVGRRRSAEKKSPSQPSPPPDSSPPPQPTSIEIDEEIEESAGVDPHVQLDALTGQPSNTSEGEPISDKQKSAPATETGGKVKDEGKPPVVGAAQPKPTDKPEQKAGEKTVVRQPSVWKQKSYQDFSPGTFSGAAATSAHDIRLAPALARLSALPENYVWRVVPDGQGGAYAGTGDHGAIYHVAPDGTSAVFYKTGELEVHSLAQDSKGNLYAGTSPNGRIFRISPDGKGEMVFDAPEKHILALAVDSKDNVYAGPGDAGVVYRLSPDGKCTKFAELAESSVLSLAVDKLDAVYAGTARDGVVYKIAPDGAVSALYNAAEDSITSLAVDGKGSVYAGTGSGKGNIYKIPASGTVKTVYDKAPKALSMAVDSGDNVYVVSDEQVIKITPDEAVMSLDTRRAGAQFVAVVVDGKCSIYAGAANTAAVYRSEAAAGGTYESPVHDAGLTSRWGTVNWIADTPQETSVALETRTGNVAEPDSTWSPWRLLGPGRSIQSPVARYVQYRATLASSNSALPVLKQVAITYLPENRPPKVTVNDPQAGGVVARTAAVKWSGADPDKDALTYDLYYSADSGKTWQPLGSGLKQPKNGGDASETTKEPQSKQESKTETPNKAETAATVPSADDLVAQLKAELEDHPEIPQEVKDKMIAEAPAAARKGADAASKPAEEPSADEGSPASGQGGPTKQTTFNWDTTKVPDGEYLIKVVASDRTSNATGFLTDEKVIGPVTVANKPPQVVVLERNLKVNADKTVNVDGYASDALVAIVGVQFKVDAADWMAAAAEDGIFDSTSEGFLVTTQPLGKGKHTIEVKTVNAASNAASGKVTVDVP